LSGNGQKVYSSVTILNFSVTEVRGVTYFNTKQVAAIVMCSALWGVLNSIFSPMFFSLTHLPLLCDLIGFAVLTFAAWWIRKFGAIITIGLISTIVNFAINPQALTFLGFTGAAFVFDFVAGLMGYNRIFTRPLRSSASAISISILSAAVAGFLIGEFFMATPALSAWGGVIGWAGLHAVGGVIGGTIGAGLVIGLVSRKVALTRI
jgi:hypothetical protein